MFRFTIRELVLLTLVVAMGVGWWLDRSNSEFEKAIMRRDSLNREKALRAESKVFESIYRAYRYPPPP